MRPPKIDFRFLFYTSKNMCFQKKGYLFFNAYKVKKKEKLYYRHKDAMKPCIPIYTNCTT